MRMKLAENGGLSSAMNHLKAIEAGSRPGGRDDKQLRKVQTRETSDASGRRNDKLSKRDA